MKKVLPLLLFFLILISGIIAQEKQKPIVAVLDLSGDGVSKAETKAITNLLISSIFETDLVSIIDRNQREEILSEIMFSLSGCTDENCAIEVGKMLAADIMVIGSIDSIGSRLSIDLKAIDVSTSKLEGTFNKLYESVDEIVNAIDAIGGQLTQNFTGQLASKKTVLEYEELVPLFISCNIEGADVFVDGVAVGKITDGTLTKALNIDAEVTLEVFEEGYYDFKQLILMDTEKEFVVEMDVLNLKRFAFKTQMGGGVMGGVSLSYFLVPNWWYLDLGFGFTITSSEPSLINFPILLKAGKYLFFDDRSRLRPYAGGVFIYDAATLYDYSSFYFKDAAQFWYGFNFGGYGGVEFKITDHIRLTTDGSLFLSQIWQGMTYFFQLSFGVTVM
jgi:hypothetical protein